MNKNTVIGIVLIAIIFMVGITLNTLIFPPTQSTTTTEQTQNTGVEAFESDSPTNQGEAAIGSASSGNAYDVVLVGNAPEATTFSVDTEKYTITFSNQGGTVIGYQLKEHTDNGQPIEMLIGNAVDQGAFMLAFGDYRSTQYANDPFYYDVAGTTVNFYQDYGVVQEDGSVESFTLTKTYRLVDGEYLFELSVDMVNSTTAAPDLNFGGISYTLNTGFDIGPPLEADAGRFADFRKFYSFYGGDRDEVKFSSGTETTTDQVAWNSVIGKYFALIGITDSTKYVLTYSKEDGKSQLLYSRPVIRSSAQEDIFRFYLGPKEKSELIKYDKSIDNMLGISGLELDEAMEKSFWGWLQTILRVILDFFYKIIPNYGVAIIFTTIVIKILLFPLTKKSYVSMGKMKDLQPKLKEIQAKHKDNPQKAQQAQMELYKQEGVNPMGGCLPMLIQFPLLIAFYGLLNAYFPLREAVFIPGWIDDLSMPEYIFRISALEGVFAIGMFEYIRLLPFIYTGSMFLSTKFSQTSSGGGQTEATMKFMTYGMPLMFFFFMYNVPSGLLLYWLFSNIITILQQIAIRKYVHNHPDAGKKKKKKGFMARLAEQAAQAQAQQQKGGKIKNSTKKQAKGVKDYTKKGNKK